MKTNPFFSIIIPTYNRSTHLKKALNSVLAQEFKDFEIIIIDDGSTDDTPTVVSEFIKKDKRVNYLFKMNEERSIARNYGINVSIGDYIGFLDSDDIVYVNHLSSAYDLLIQNQLPEVCHLGYEKISEQGVVIFQRGDLDGHLADRLIEENLMHCNAIFVKRQIALQYPFINHKSAIIAEDWYVWLRLAARFKIHTSSQITSAIVEHPARSLNKIDAAALTECVDLIVQNLKRDRVFLDYYKHRARYFFARQYSFAMLLLSLNRQRKEYFKYLLKALQEDIRIVASLRFIASIKYIIFPFLIRKTI
jgi:glycosyltransferase involved in cell wall biosynthesis